MMRSLGSITLWISLISAPFLLRQQSCSIGQERLYLDAPYIQKKNVKTLDPAYQLYHFSSDSSRLYYRLKYEQLTARTDSKGQTQVAFRLSYMLLAGSKSLLDSGSVVVADSSNGKHPDYLEGSIQLHTKSASKNLLKLTLADLVSKSNAYAHLIVDQTQNWNKQYFQWFDTYTEKPLFSNYLPTDPCRDFDNLKMRCEASQIDSLQLHHFSLLKIIPAPPFAADYIFPLPEKADSNIVFSYANEHICSLFNKEGIYRIGPDTTAKKGLSVFLFGLDFPVMHSQSSMLEPLRFLTTAAEFKELGQKKADDETVDTFWLQAGGNETRALELKRRFYERIADSNRFFSSFVEGWRTDRGMIYLLMGPPDRVERSENIEIWYYTTTGSNYIFRKVDNPFSDAHYVLDRSETYRESWYTMVQKWREGRIAN